MIRLFATVVALFLLSGCASVGTLNTSFDPNSAALIHAKGKGVITGQAFLRRNDGIVVYGAGSDVSLMPKTAYTDEMMNQMFGGAHYAYAAKTFKNQDPAFAQYVRHTTADGEGRFTFSDVADGSYYIVSYVVWSVNYEQQGGGVMMPVTVAGGLATNIIMSGD